MRILAPLFAAFALLTASLGQSAYAKPRELSGPIRIGEQTQAVDISQDYEIKPAIWRLQDRDTTIYMFGTIHLLPRDFEWRTERFNTIVNEVDELIVETSDEDIADSFEDVLPLMMKRMTSSKPISARLSPPAAARWMRFTSMMGMDAELMDRAPLVMTMFAMGDISENGGGSSRLYGVETVLEAEFAEAEKPVGSIEEANSVLRRLLAIDESLIIREMERDLLKWDGASVSSLMQAGASVTGAQDVTEDPWAIEHAWASGANEGLDIANDGRSKFLNAFWGVLLNDRNEQWVDWIEKRLDQPGNILIAVGAAHFEGDDSVLLKLRERGLRVTRIQ